jgi:hypothetical protein
MPGAQYSFGNSKATTLLYEAIARANQPRLLGKVHSVFTGRVTLLYKLMGEIKDERTLRWALQAWLRLLPDSIDNNQNTWPNDVKSLLKNVLTAYYRRALELVNDGHVEKQKALEQHNSGGNVASSGVP